MTQSGWVSQIRVIGGFFLVFAGVAALGIFLTAAGQRSTAGAITCLAATAVCFGTGGLLLWVSSHRRGGVIGPKPEPAKELSYHQRIRGRFGNVD
jgi:hypothetical protein